MKCILVMDIQHDNFVMLAPFASVAEMKSPDSIILHTDELLLDQHSIDWHIKCTDGVVKYLGKEGQLHRFEDIPEDKAPYFLDYTHEELKRFAETYFGHPVPVVMQPGTPLGEHDGTVYRVDAVAADIVNQRVYLHRPRRNFDPVLRPASGDFVLTNDDQLLRCHVEPLKIDGRQIMHIYVRPPVPDVAGLLTSVPLKMAG